MKVHESSHTYESARIHETYLNFCILFNFYCIISVDIVYTYKKSSCLHVWAHRHSHHQIGINSSNSAHSLHYHHYRRRRGLLVNAAGVKGHGQAKPDQQ